MQDTALLLWGVVFSSIGFGFFIYGKRQKAIVPLVCGIGLFVFPYFVDDLWLMLLIGAGLMAVPYFVRI
jgi:predicted membrane protein